jgi:hypothetical protein
MRSLAERIRYRDLRLPLLTGRPPIYYLWKMQYTCAELGTCARQMPANAHASKETRRNVIVRFLSGANSQQLRAAYSDKGLERPLS